MLFWRTRTSPPLRQPTSLGLNAGTGSLPMPALCRAQPGSLPPATRAAPGRSLCHTHSLLRQLAALATQPYTSVREPL